MTGYNPRHDKIFDIECRIIPRMVFSYDKEMLCEPNGSLRTIQFGWLTIIIWKKDKQ